jgi:predicted amidohydrolase YtcJ
MREAHVHLAALGESLAMLDLASCRSAAQCLEQLTLETARASTERPRQATSVSEENDHGRAKWARAFGARVEGWVESRWPTLAELDAATGDTPTVVMSFDHHSALANSAALAAAKLSPGQVVPPNGLVCTDSAGRATGLLQEQAAYAAWNAAPEPTMGQRRRDVLRALKLLGAMGFDEVHDLHSQSWLGPLLGELDRAGTLRARVRLFPPASRLVEDCASRRLWESDMVRIAGGKVFADGTLNSRTALMLTPYASPLDEVGPLGKAMVSRSELNTYTRTCAELGLELAVHAIGDGAVRMVLDEWESVRATGAKGGDGGEGTGGEGRGLRIEHCELIDEADIERFVRLGVICSVQPCHLLTDIEVLTRQFPRRLGRVLPLRDLIQAGLKPGRTLIFGSDAPIVRPNPEDSVLAATLRRRRDMPEAHAIAREQSIDDKTAWACFGSATPSHALPIIEDR